MIATEYRDGMSMSQLGTKYGVNLVTIRNALLRQGEPTRRKGNVIRTFSEQQGAVIVARWQAGESQEAIARDLGTAQTIISRVLRHQGVSRSRPRGNWKGGRINSPAGYVSVLVRSDDPFASMRNAGGYVLEHRLVLAQKLGRPLLPTETTHHINGIKHDNRPENLQLRTGKHGKHEAWQCLDCGSANIAAVPLKDTPHD